MSTHAAAKDAKNPFRVAAIRVAAIRVAAIRVAAIRVALLGASGIGKNHARWFASHGCEVCAFLGSSSESIERTRLVLQRDSNFAGRAYTDLETLLRLEKPDAVCIATPPELHCAQTRQCLEAGAHVLCEKPLVGDENLPIDELIAQAQHLEKHARERGLLLETQTQYAGIARRVLEMCGVEKPESMRRWTMEMETKNLVAGRDYEKIWIDLSPHPISLLLALGAEIELETVSCIVAEQGTTAEFRVRFGTGNAMCAVKIDVRVNPNRAVPLRRIAINDRYVDYSSGKNASGVFRNYLTSDDGRVVEMDDLVDSHIAEFIARVTAAKSDINAPEHDSLFLTNGAQNVEWQLKILQKSRRA